MSIWKDGKPLFAGDKYADLSQEALYFIGGILHHAKALNAFTNPGTNSYKRLIPGFEAPVLRAYSAATVLAVFVSHGQSHQKQNALKHVSQIHLRTHTFASQPC